MPISFFALLNRHRLGNPALALMACFWQLAIRAGKQGRLMVGGDKSLIHLRYLHPQEALENLNRITGLKFSHWPESLVPASEKATAEPEIDDEAANEAGSA